MKLRSNAPSDLVLLSKDDWSEIERGIWDSFDEYIDGIFLGACTNPEKLCIGRLAEISCVVARQTSWEEPSSDEEENPLPIVLCIETYLMIYDTDGSHHSEMITGVFSEEDGVFNIFKDSIPESHRWAIEDAYSPDEICQNEFRKLIKNSCGGIENIIDPWVAKYVKNVLSDV